MNMWKLEEKLATKKRKAIELYTTCIESINVIQRLQCKTLIQALWVSRNSMLALHGAPLTKNGLLNNFSERSTYVNASQTLEFKGQILAPWFWLNEQSSASCYSTLRGHQMIWLLTVSRCKLETKSHNRSVVPCQQLLGCLTHGGQTGWMWLVWQLYWQLSYYHNSTPGVCDLNLPMATLLSGSKCWWQQQTVSYQWLVWSCLLDSQVEFEIVWSLKLTKLQNVDFLRLHVVPGSSWSAPLHSARHIATLWP